MRFYGTIRSERAAKSQGGNEALEIELRKGSRDDSHLEYTMIYDESGLVVRGNGGILLETGDRVKGEQQKGEKEDYAYPDWIDKLNPQ
jgi:hypothetical protein